MGTTYEDVLLAKYTPKTSDELRLEAGEIQNYLRFGGSQSAKEGLAFKLGVIIRVLRARKEWPVMVEGRTGNA